MASIKVKFHNSTVVGREGYLYFHIIHNRILRQFFSGYKIFPSEWDDRRGRIVIPESTLRSDTLLSIRQNIRLDFERLVKIARALDLRGTTYTTDDIIEEYHRHRDDYSLFNYMRKIILKQWQNGKIRTAETYRSALSSFRKFNNGKDIALDHITSETMEAYEAWLKGSGLIPNSTSFYMRILRAVYNRAVDGEIIDNRNPFRKIYTGVDKTVKRALPLHILKRIIRLDLSAKPALDYARDMFMMSFYLRGMSFIDMAHLKKSDLTDGRIAYRRRKTGQRLVIAWEKEMQAILDKYPANPTEFLLPIITNNSSNIRNTYRNRSYNINHSLKEIAAMVGISTPLTLYVARHSWASAAKVKGIPIGVISEGMGHDSEATTRIYLASLETTAVDKANSIILKSLHK